MADLRARFSPAPTGSLHVGSAHTALFNYLFARHHGGEFFLRIEDTDPERSRPELSMRIQEDLRWLGLQWDGDAIHQSTHFDRYWQVVEQLLASGHAYECFETPEELEAINQERRAAGLAPGYDGRARDLTAAERERLRAEGRPRTVRFRVPDAGQASFVDLLRGEVSVEWSSISDFVMLRSNGAPVFYLANAVDDLDMRITHVVRGEDLIDSTHRVLAIRAALGVGDAPAYAHLPLILGPDRAKLSKRHGAVSLDEFRAGGYLPEAFCNYLALLGWAPADDREILSLDELVAAFDLDRVTHANAVFDHGKLDWVNQQWIKGLPLADLQGRVVTAAHERFGDHVDDNVLRGAVRIGQERATTVNALLDQSASLFVDEDDFEVEPASWARVVGTERIGDVLDAALAHLEGCEWGAEAIDLRGPIEALGIKPRSVMPALYAALEGRAAGLPLFDYIELLGRERAVERLRRARRALAA